MSNELKITCISAQLTRDTQMFSNMDPYVVIQCASQKRKTRTHQEGGKKPRWNDSFTFLNPKSQQVKFSVWDEDTVTDDLIGEGVLDISKYFSSPNKPQQEYITLLYKSKAAGKLYVQVEYRGSSGSNNGTWGSSSKKNIWGSSNDNNNNWGNTNDINQYGSNWAKNNNNGTSWGNNNNNNGTSWGNNNNNGSTWGNNNNADRNPNVVISNGNNQSNWGQNNSNPINPYNNTQGWGSFNPSQQAHNSSWGQNNYTSETNNDIQYPNLSNIQKKASSNSESGNGINPYGDFAQGNNPNYPPQQSNSNQIPMAPNNNNNDPIAMMLGAKLFGVGQQPNTQTYTQPQVNVMNVLDMALKGGIKPNPQQNNYNNGWPQQQPNTNQTWNQPQQQNWGQQNQPQNQNWMQQNPPQQQNNSYWSQQPGNGWQNTKPNNSGWGNGW